jgi:hypothetical protein
LAAALDVPLRELVAPVPRLERVRFRSLERLKSRDQILAHVARWLRDFSQLEEMLGDRQHHALASLWEQLKADGGRDPGSTSPPGCRSATRSAAPRHRRGQTDRPRT